MAPEDEIEMGGSEILGVFSTEDKARDWMKNNGYEYGINMVYSAIIDDPGFGEWVSDPYDEEEADRAMNPDAYEDEDG